jgi:hypothetical protein
MSFHPRGAASAALVAGLAGPGFDPCAGFGAEFRITLRLRGPSTNEPTRERVR